MRVNGARRGSRLMDGKNGNASIHINFANNSSISQLYAVSFVYPRLPAWPVLSYESGITTLFRYVT